MARVPQKQALEVLKERVRTVDERYGGYRADLVETLDKVVDLESDRPQGFKQQISREMKALGERIIQQEGKIE